MPRCFKVQRTSEGRQNGVLVIFSRRSTQATVVYRYWFKLLYMSVCLLSVAAPVGRRVGSIADYDPMNENYGSLTQGYHPTSRSNSMTQEWEETVPLSPSSVLGPGLPGERRNNFCCL